MQHGGDLTEAIARYGGTSTNWLDLSTGINPWPWPIPDQLPDYAWHRLPSRVDNAVLIDAARRAYGVAGDIGIVAAPGTQAVIQWLPHLAAGGTVAIIGPTYGEHARVWAQADHEIIADVALDSIPDRARHVVVVNPNNPDGRLFNQQALAALAMQLAARNGWLVIDEAFIDPDPIASAVALCGDFPVIILRSFGKFYGLAGLRLGFAIAAPAIAQRIANAFGPWAVSGPAIAIGTAALTDSGWAADMRIKLAQQANKLDAVLVAAGCEIVGGTALFRLVRHRRAKALHDHLARQRVWVRSFEWDNDLLRFGCPDADGLDRLTVALAST